MNDLEKQNPADAIERTPRAENRREGKPTNDNSIQIAFTSSRRRASEGRKFRPPGKGAKGEADKHNKLSNSVVEKEREQEQQQRPTNRRKNQQQQRKAQEQSGNQRRSILPPNILHEVQDQRFKVAKHEMSRQGSRSKIQVQ